MCVGNVGVALFLIWFSIACIEPSVVATIVPNNPSTLDTLRIQLSGDQADILSVRWIKQDKSPDKASFSPRHSHHVMRYGRQMSL